MINHAEKINCRAFVSEKYFRHFSEKTFSAESILMLDLDPIPCPANKCTELPKLIQRRLPCRQINFQTSNIFPPKPISSVPDLVLFRPRLNEPVEEITRSLRKAWSQASVLALFCVGWNDTSGVSQSLLNTMDDFLSCPFKEMDLFLRLERLLHWKSGRVASSEAKPVKGNLHLDSLVGESACFLRVLEKIPLLARSNAAVLISGETGTGKELFARAIHYQGPRKGKPFIPVNCGALPDHLFENELFGHARGAFTDASSPQHGLITEAEGGTLLLDEIDSLSPSAQVKILRFLQNGEYRPLGSSQTMTADVRIIATTNTDLKRLLELKLFREDLYHRLNVLSFCIAPLRERIEDIPHLASHFVTRYAIQYGREPVRLSPAALQKLMVYSWPGNVRELEGLIQRVLVLISGSVLRQEDIDLPLPHSGRIADGGSLREAKSLAIEEFERSYVANLLAAYRGNITHAARAAAKERRAFQRLVRKHGLNRYSFQA